MYPFENVNAVTIAVAKLLPLGSDVTIDSAVITNTVDLVNSTSSANFSARRYGWDYHFRFKFVYRSRNFHVSSRNADYDRRPHDLIFRTVRDRTALCEWDYVNVGVPRRS